MPCPRREGSSAPHRLTWDCLKMGHAQFCFEHQLLYDAGGSCSTCAASARRAAERAQAMLAFKEVQKKRKPK
ncbi:hypothetical protein D9615_008818 [Tricholomella constricta]|uniref:Uncharacterized protein n=1 Tax=Tricholomella constricta TaxID=117010 RepID=A0A8H5LYJ4_9AGAR|nr:hypothetical protein D9615_008818 [Tricholomella constricta]